MKLFLLLYTDEPFDCQNNNDIDRAGKGDLGEGEDDGDEMGEYL